MGCSFRIDHGRGWSALAEKRESRLHRLTENRGEYLSEERWRHAIDRGHASVMFVEAVDWLFQIASVRPLASLSEECEFLASYRPRSKPSLPPDSGPKWLNLLEFTMAEAALEWHRFGTMPLGALEAFGGHFEQLLQWHGASGRSTAEFVRDSGRDSAALIFDRKFVAMAVLQKWSWILSNFSPGFDETVTRRPKDGHNTLIIFAYQLAQHCALKGCTLAESKDVLSALTSCCESWTKSFLRGQPWDRASYYAYFCVAAYERACRQHAPTVSDVAAAFLGSANPGSVVEPQHHG